MKLTVIVPSAQFLDTAGTRIRYQRLLEPLGKVGCRLSLATIDDPKLTAPGDPNSFYLFSKVIDARGLALAQSLKQQGASVGVDLFDDYFSQFDDARFAAQRLWLNEMAGISDFYLCSTPRMKEVAGHYFKEKPGLVLNDPFDKFEPDRLGLRIEQKRRKALDTRTIDMLWFGIGDNPSFAVGLHDLVQFGQRLGQFRRAGFALRLTVLTNARALTASGLALLRQLPIEPVVEEWSTDRESALLERCMVSFLPVNGQEFSIAKSLNRAVTAITGGTQILTAGYPLYRSLSSFTYAQPVKLVEDILSDSLLISTQTLPALGNILTVISCPSAEAKALYGFLKSIGAKPVVAATSDVPIAILHGAQSPSAIHKFARERRWLSLGSPLTPVGATYDGHLAVFEPGARPKLRLTAALANRLPEKLAEKASILPGDGKRYSVELCADDIAPGTEAILTSLAARNGFGVRLALCNQIMETTRRLYSQALGPHQFIASERDPQLNHAAEMASADLQERA